jgi:outer membrane protein assembly factor BamD (BamD/ComL family)
MRRLAFAVAVVALTGCTAPPSEGPGDEPEEAVVARPAPARKDRDGTATALGDLGGALATAKPLADDSPRTGPRAEKLEVVDSAWKEATARFEAHDYDAAADAFSRAYQYSSRSRRAEEALFLLAESSFLAGNYVRALQSYEKLLKVFPATDRYPTALERIFQIGKVFCEKSAKKPSLLLGIPMTDVEYGIETLDRFAKQRDRHPLAPEALFVMGETRLREGEGELAIEVWQRLVKGYPQSKWAALAEYQTALAFLSLSGGVQYDKRPIMTGLKRLRAYVRKYPTGDRTAEATEKLRSLEEELARHELAVARTYARTDHWDSARIYLDAIVREYPKTTAADQARELAKTWPLPPAEPPK